MRAIPDHARSRGWVDAEPSGTIERQAVRYSGPQSRAAVANPWDRAVDAALSHYVGSMTVNQASLVQVPSWMGHSEIPRQPATCTPARAGGSTAEEAATTRRSPRMARDRHATLDPGRQPRPVRRADAADGLYSEGTLMQYVVTIALDYTGAVDESDALLDTFLVVHAEASPVVGEDIRAGTIDVTFAVDAGDGYEAFERGRAVFSAATADTTFARPVVAVSVELADEHALEPA